MSQQLKLRQAGSEMVSQRTKRAPIACLESRRPPVGGPRLACVVTSNGRWGGRRESNPRDLLGRQELCH